MSGEDGWSCNFSISKPSSVLLISVSAFSLSTQRPVSATVSAVAAAAATPAGCSALRSGMSCATRAASPVCWFDRPIARHFDGVPATPNFRSVVRFGICEPSWQRRELLLVQAPPSCSASTRVCQSTVSSRRFTATLPYRSLPPPPRPLSPVQIHFRPSIQIAYHRPLCVRLPVCLSLAAWLPGCLPGWLPVCLSLWPMCSVRSVC